MQSYNPDWASQTTIPPEKQYAMLVCLFYFDLDILLLVRYLGNNYTGAYREIHVIVETLHKFKINPNLITKYVRVMLTGCPNHFVVDTTHANTLMHWRLRNHPSIDKKTPPGASHHEQGGSK